MAEGDSLCCVGKVASCTNCINYFSFATFQADYFLILWLLYNMTNTT